MLTYNDQTDHYNIQTSERTWVPALSGETCVDAWLGNLL